MGRKASPLKEELETRRSDYGHLKRKERDWGALELIGSMRVMRFDTLGEYWAPDHSVASALPDQQKSDEIKQEEQTGPGRGGKRTGETWPPDWPHRSMAVARILYKLEAHGLVKRWQAWDGQPQWVALTEEGYRYQRLLWHELDWPDPDTLNHDGRYSISHTHRVNQMRMRLLAGAAGVPKHTWISEREIEASFPAREQGINTGEGSAQGFLLNIVDQATGHEVVFVHMGNWLTEGTMTTTASIAPAVNDDPNVLSSHWLIQIDLGLLLVFVKFAMGTTRRRSVALHLNVKVVFILVYCKNMIVCQSQDIQTALSLPEVLPHEFLCSRENPVTQERRVLRVTCNHSPHFYDVDLLCTDVKNGGFPRTFTNSPNKKISLCQIRVQANFQSPYYLLDAPLRAIG